MHKMIMISEIMKDQRPSGTFGLTISLLVLNIELYVIVDNHVVLYLCNVLFCVLIATHSYITLTYMLH